MSSKLFEARVYTIKALTNLHVGNGEVSYSVLDKQVQRDVITSLPQINASSLKGALREFATYSLLDKCDIKGEKAASVCKTVFGLEPNASEKTSSPKPGYLNFFDAKLLALPVRTDKEAFFMATSEEVLLDFLKTSICFEQGIKITEEELKRLEEGYFHSNTTGEVIAEEQDWKLSKKEVLKPLTKLFGDKVVFLSNKRFRQLAKELPFVARNYLENGKSENLWYEEIVPRESLFYTVIQSPNETLMAYKMKNNHEHSDKDIKVKEHIDIFHNCIKKSELFIGANTTVGYGLCHIEEM